MDAQSRGALIGMVLAQAEQVGDFAGDLSATASGLCGAALEVRERSATPDDFAQLIATAVARIKGKPSRRPRAKRKHGSPVGHAKHERQFVADPDYIVESKAPRAACYTADLQDQAGAVGGCEPDHRSAPCAGRGDRSAPVRGDLPGSAARLRSWHPPAGLEMSRSFGTRLESLVIYYRQEQHMSYERTQTALRNLHGVAISQGGIDQIMQRAGQQSGGCYGSRLEQGGAGGVRSSTVTKPAPVSTASTGGNGFSAPPRRFCTSSNPVVGRMSS